MKRLESRIAALEESNSEKLFLWAVKRLNETDEEAISRGAAEQDVQLPDVAAVLLWCETPDPPLYEAGEEAIVEWAKRYPAYKRIDLKRHDGIEKLRGYAEYRAQVLAAMYRLSGNERKEETF